MQLERSAGFIVMRETRQGPLFLLLQAYHGFWGFPKGGVEQGERFIDTAVRELKEETGIDRFFVISGFRTQYSYAHKERKEMARETVVLYIAKTDTAIVKLSREHTAFRWLPYDAMVKTISFDNARRPFVRACRFLAGVKKIIALQEKVYDETRRIPKGKVVSYADIARRCGSTPRAVARMLANSYDARVPCHRVISSSGAILGYNKGAKEKERLLRSEGVAFTHSRKKGPCVARSSYDRSR